MIPRRVVQFALLLLGLTIIYLSLVAGSYEWLFGGQEEDWRAVCALLQVDHTKIKKPKIKVVDKNREYILRCGPGGDSQGCYYWLTDTIYLDRKYANDRKTLIHEMAHAVMFSHEYQERIAEWVERMVE